MRRWLIAIFTLHFFVSVGLFTFGAFSAGVAHDVAALAQDADTPHTPSVALGGLDTTADHGLTDGQPDLPEVIHEPFALAPAVLVPTGLYAPTPLRHIGPALAGLQRPPRSTALI